MSIQTKRMWCDAGLVDAPASKEECGHAGADARDCAEVKTVSPGAAATMGITPQCNGPEGVQLHCSASQKNTTTVAKGRRNPHSAEHAPYDNGCVTVRAQW